MCNNTVEVPIAVFDNNTEEENRKHDDQLYHHSKACNQRVHLGGRAPGAKIQFLHVLMVEYYNIQIRIYTRDIPTRLHYETHNKIHDYKKYHYTVDLRSIQVLCRIGPLFVHHLGPFDVHRGFCTNI
jgi:hypothetical protein